jgi:flavin reductase (DIM6/NTAB) family NADH-FMN oxidoreductase RutF
MVTVGDFDNANILTIAWTGILATQPPKTYISVRPSRHSYGILKEKGEFVINLPSVDLVKATDYVGIYTGAKVDKWEKTGLTKAKSEKVSPPTIAECPIALECKVCEVIPMGSHDVFMADIVSVSCKDEIIDEAGKMRFDRADLLAYAHGEYYSLGEVVGRFGFSTDKPKKEEKKPFYASVPKGKSQKKKPTDKNKGAPHGRRVKK